ncbi:hypothetical protein V8C86DRAFT_2533812 [Haematococcus lacustris]
MLPQPTQAEARQVMPTASAASSPHSVTQDFHQRQPQQAAGLPGPSLLPAQQLPQAIPRLPGRLLSGPSGHSMAAGAGSMSASLNHMRAGQPGGSGSTQDLLRAARPSTLPSQAHGPALARDLLRSQLSTSVARPGHPQLLSNHTNSTSSLSSNRPSPAASSNASVSNLSSMSSAASSMSSGSQYQGQYSQGQGHQARMQSGSLAAGSGKEGAEQQSQDALHSLLAAAAAAAAKPGVDPATIQRIMSELKDQGMAGSKEQLVTSLSQLLAQLLQ